MTNNSTNHATELARLAADVATALEAAARYWDANHLPGDFATTETGYAFPGSIDEQAAAARTWADRLATMQSGPCVMCERQTCETVVGRIGDRVGVMCGDCQYHYDGNIES